MPSDIKHDDSITSDEHEAHESHSDDDDDDGDDAHTPVPSDAAHDSPYTAGRWYATVDR